MDKLKISKKLSNQTVTEMELEFKNSKQLQNICREYGLRKTGSNVTMIARIKEFLQKSPAERSKIMNEKKPKNQWSKKKAVSKLQLQDLEASNSLLLNIVNEFSSEVDSSSSDSDILEDDDNSKIQENNGQGRKRRPNYRKIVNVLDCMRSQIDQLFNMIDDLKEEFQKNIDDETEEMQTPNKKIKIDNEDSTDNTDTNNVVITDS